MSNLDLFNRDLSMIIDGSIISYIRDRLAFSCETLSLGQYLSYFNGAFREFGFCNFLNVGTYTIRVAYLGYLDPICMVHNACSGITFNINGEQFKFCCVDNSTRDFVVFNCVDNLIDILNN